jgi:hypothetical protein
MRFHGNGMYTFTITYLLYIKLHRVEDIMGILKLKYR